MLHGSLEPQRRLPVPPPRRLVRQVQAQAVDRGCGDAAQADHAAGCRRDALAERRDGGGPRPLSHACRVRSAARHSPAGQGRQGAFVALAAARVFPVAHARSNALDEQLLHSHCRRHTLGHRQAVHREPGQAFGSGSFTQDSQGRWFVNLPVEVGSLESAGGDAIGIDLGLKELAVLSNGEKIGYPSHYRRMEARIATAQRARHKRQVRKLHAKVKAQRQDHLHQESTRLVREHGAIFVGNVSASGLAKTNMAKSVLDAGWSAFRTQLEYKARRHQVVFAEISEAFSTQTCSRCASIEGPKGVAGLGIRRWQCSCGVEHDRDTNAAQNIVARGLAGLAEGACHGKPGIPRL